MSETGFSGGCQCGAVRFHAGKLGRASICHCRMCQKHFGNFFGALVSADQAHPGHAASLPSSARRRKSIAVSATSAAHR